MDPGNRASSADTLHGWKEIAAYVGKSVRAAQRWEHELGLPVRRLKTHHSQVIFASRQEIDDWRRRLEVEPGGGPPAERRFPVAGLAGPAVAPGRPSRGLAQFSWLWVAMTTLGLALLIWFWR